MAGRLSTVDVGFDTTELARLEENLHNIEKQEISSAEAVYKAKVELYKRELAEREQLQKTVNQKLVQLGIAASKEEQEARLKSAKETIAKERKAKMDAERKKIKAEGGDWNTRKKQIQQEYDERWKKEKANLEKREKKEKQIAKNVQKAALAEQNRANMAIVTGKGYTLEERKAAWKKATTSKNNAGEDVVELGGIATAISDLAKQLEQKVDSIGKRKGTIDTRLQGSKNKRKFGLQGLSYWDQLSTDITGIAGVSPYITQESVVNNLETLVSKGISYNVEQRAFLATMADKIATTFDVSNGTLLRLIRIQQQDSTAARLGMESALNAFLNNMYETTEYLSDLASSVRSSLEEAQALMDMAAATELEYQIQKWMGSMYSVGMSSGGVSSIASALGKVIAGDISGITAGGAGNLVVMAANQAGASIADMLAEGLDASKTNSLMQSMVNYLAELYENSKDSRVVQQQLAGVYGLTASDLKAIANLADTNTMKNLYNNKYSYGSMMNRLYSMADSMWQRTSMGEMMSNVWENFQYTMAAGMANNPVLYMLEKAATLLEDTTGGIRLPDIGYLGTKVNLNTTVSALMRVAAMSGSILSGMGAMIGNLGAGGGFSGSGMLRSLGVGGNLTNYVSRGSGTSRYSTSGLTVSSSGMVGQSDAGDIKNKTMQDANDEANPTLVEAQESESNDIERKVVNDSVLKIYELLSEIVDGSKTLTTQSREDAFPWMRALV